MGKTVGFNLGQEFLDKLTKAGGITGAQSIVKSDESIFTRRIPSFEEFVTSKEFLGQPPLSTRQMEAAINILGSEDPDKIFVGKRNESVLCWGKGCTHKNSKLTLSNGERHTIQELIDANEEVELLAWDESTGTIVPSLASVPFYMGEGEIVRVHTKTGRQLDVFIEHRFLTTSRDPRVRRKHSPEKQGRRWEYLSNLTVGDVIALPQHIPAVGTLSDPNWARLLGYFIGDGACSTDNVCPKLKCENLPEVVNDIRETWNTVGDSYPSEWPDRNCTWFGSGQLVWDTRRGDNIVYEKTKEYGLIGKNAYTKSIPNQAFSFDEESTWQLLSGLWMTDGWICRNDTRTGTWEVGYGAQSEELIRDIAELLHRYGIIAKITRKKSSYNGEPYFSWVLKIHNRSMIQEFIDRITLVGPKGNKVEQIKQQYLLGLAVSGKGNKFYRDSLVWDTITQIESLGVQEFYDIEVYEHENYIAQGILNHNSGKDLVSSYIIAYLTYMLLCMKNPQGFLGLANDEPIDIVNVASNAEQARTVFFNKLKARIKRPCFAPYTPRLNKTQIIFPNNIVIHSLHSANESWEGMNIFLWVMDEASAFRTVSGKDNAEQVYGTLKSSARSRFPVIRWIGVIISFPRQQVGDFTLNKYLEAKGNPNIYADRAATWDIHPFFDPTHPMFQNIPWVDIPDINVRVPEPYVQDFARDSVDSQTKYMADPPLTEGGFFDNPAAIDQAVNDKIPLIIVERSVRERFEPDTGKTLKFSSLSVSNLPERDKESVYWMHGDPGLTQDTFALCVCHTPPTEAKEVVDSDGKSIMLKHTVVDFVLDWIPKRGTPVDLINQEEIMYMLIDMYGIKRVTFDRWNSAHSIQKLQNRGVQAEDLSFSLEQQTSMFRHLKLLVYNRMLELPPGHEELLNEIKFLRLHNGKITHDIHGKDRADAVAAAVWNAAGRMSRTRQLVQETLEGLFVPTESAGAVISPLYL